MSIVLWILTFLLILVSIFIVLVVLAQKSKDGGMGSALGGGAVEATFGGEAGNVLTRWTIGAAVLFFVLAFGLYLGRIYEAKHAGSSEGALPTIAAPAVAPAAPATGTTPPPSGTAPASDAKPIQVPTTTTTPASTSEAPKKQP